VRSSDSVATGTYALRFVVLGMFASVASGHFVPTGTSARRPDSSKSSPTMDTANGTVRYGRTGDALQSVTVGANRSTSIADIGPNVYDSFATTQNE